jgi:hypothetical protein
MCRVNGNAVEAGLLSKLGSIHELVDDCLNLRNGHLRRSTEK